MDEQEAREFENSFINQDNCPLNFEFLFNTPPFSGTKDRGNNVLHFNSQNRPYYENNQNIREFVKKQLNKAIPCESESQVIQEAVRYSQESNKNSKNGIYLEFGFCTGRTLNFIAALGYNKNIFGFDSVDGLPNEWSDKPKRFPKGTFKYRKQYIITVDEEMILLPRLEEDNEKNENEQDKGKQILNWQVIDNECEPQPFIPFIPLPNVQLILGEIYEKLGFFKEYVKDKNLQIELIHIDTDIFESCEAIYKRLDDLILPDKTVVILDEGYNWEGEDGSSDNPYEAWKNHEFKATRDFAKEKDYKIKYLAYNKEHQQLALIFNYKKKRLL
jgi:hypothetical protein